MRPILLLISFGATIIRIGVGAPTLEFVGVGFCKDSQDRFYDSAILYSTLVDACDTACVDDSACVGFDHWTINNVCNLRFSDGTIPNGKYTTTSATSTQGTGKIMSASGTSGYVCHRKDITLSPTNAPTTAAPTSSPTSSCNSRIMLVTDRTYRRQPREKVAVGLQFALEFVNNLEFGGASLGHVNLKQHTISEVISIDSSTATDQAAWQSHLAIDRGGYRHRATQFWLLYSTIADEVKQSGIQSYILLLTDGQLQQRKNLQKHVILKRKMQNRLGSDAPQIICVRIGVQQTSKFLSKICDKIVYDGSESKTLVIHAQELASYVCAVP